MRVKSLQPIKVEAQSLRDAGLHDHAEVGPLGVQSLRDIPQSVTALDAALLAAQGASSLSDALRNVPGITRAAPRAGRSATASTCAASARAPN